MKLSEETLRVLKNYSQINPSIRVKPGNVIDTISSMKTVYSKTDVEETFDKEFGIYDLSKFIGSLSIFEDPDLEFHDKFVTIKEGKQTIKFAYADPSMIITPPEKEIKLPSADVKFKLTAKNFDRLQKSLGILNLEEICIEGTGSEILVKTNNSKDPTSDSYSIEVGESEETFSSIFRAENLKFMLKDYDVTLSYKGIAEFRSDKTVYFVPAETKNK